jgi:cobalt-precorrin-5B (C1)-methyltransferase
MMRDAIAEAAAAGAASGDVEIEIAVPGGESLAQRTMNGRLGIVGGISILGTTGIVVPYSCAAWIASIHSGIDVARAAGLSHIAAATGSTSERAVAALYALPEIALVDMGDFAGGLLKYLRRHPVQRLTLAGGFAKIAKLGQGHLDLHSGRSRVDLDWLAARLAELGASPATIAGARSANSALEILESARGAGLGLGDAVAAKARAVARDLLGDAPIGVEVAIFDREGRLVGRADG